MDKEQVKKILRSGNSLDIANALKEYFKINHAGLATAITPQKQAMLESFNTPLT